MNILEKSSRYYQPLMDMIASVNEVVPISESNQVLLVLKLNTDIKVQQWFDWLYSKLKDDNTLDTTEAEIVRVAVRIDKGIAI